MSSTAAKTPSDTPSGRKPRYSAPRPSTTQEPSDQEEDSAPATRARTLRRKAVVSSPVVLEVSSGDDEKTLDPNPQARLHRPKKRKALPSDDDNHSGTGDLDEKERPSKKNREKVSHGEDKGNEGKRRPTPATTAASTNAVASGSQHLGEPKAREMYPPSSFGPYPYGYPHAAYSQQYPHPPPHPGYGYPGYPPPMPPHFPQNPSSLGMQEFGAFPGHAPPPASSYPTQHWRSVGQEEK